MHPSALATEIRSIIASDFAGLEASHDLAHLDRVWRTVCHIASQDGGALEILAPATYLHDYHRLVEQRNGHASVVMPGECERDVRDILATMSFPCCMVSKVCDAILATDSHSFGRAGPPPPLTLEGAVLSDADNLDAMGAVGIARAFAYGARIGEPIWDADVPHAADYRAGRTHSVVHHLEEKILRLVDDMHTPTGKRLARVRHIFTVSFLNQLKAEWLGSLEH